MKNGYVIKLNTIERAKNFYEDIKDFDSDIDLMLNRYTIDAKSIMEIFSLDLSNNLFVKIISPSEEEIKRFGELMKKYIVEE